MGDIDVFLDFGKGNLPALYGDKLVIKLNQRQYLSATVAGSITVTICAAL